MLGGCSSKPTAASDAYFQITFQIGPCLSRPVAGPSSPFSYDLNVKNFFQFSDRNYLKGEDHQKDRKIM